MWETSYLAVSVLLSPSLQTPSARDPNVPVDDARRGLGMVSPESVDAFEALAARLTHPGRADRARALAEVGQHIAEDIEELAFR